MTTKALIYAEIDKLAQDDLEAAYAAVKQLAVKNHRHRRASLMARLKRVRIQGPPDFAANLDLYSTGEKRVKNLP